MKRLKPFFILPLFLSLELAFAQYNQTDWNTLTITTYYPAPYGVYRNLRLNPSDDPTGKQGVTEGVMYYDQNLHMMRYLNNSIWVNITDINCHLTAFTTTPPTTTCPVGYYTWSALASGPSGYMLCCKVNNPP
jgi:hypothetical protein